ncbi:MAG: hypothetical protein AAB849_01245 [Patescibacteria group bacterium]
MFGEWPRVLIPEFASAIITLAVFFVSQYQGLTDKEAIIVAVAVGTSTLSYYALRDWKYGWCNKVELAITYTSILVADLAALFTIITTDIAILIFAIISTLFVVVATAFTVVKIYDSIHVVWVMMSYLIEGVAIFLFIYFSIG